MHPLVLAWGLGAITSIVAYALGFILPHYEVELSSQVVTFGRLVPLVDFVYKAIAADSLELANRLAFTSGVMFAGFLFVLPLPFIGGFRVPLRLQAIFDLQMFWWLVFLNGVVIVNFFFPQWIPPSSWPIKLALLSDARYLLFYTNFAWVTFSLYIIGMWVRTAIRARGMRRNELGDH